MNKKIVMSLSVIGAVAAVVVGGTSAFFSDSETSTGNTFTAGSIDLWLGSTFSSASNNANGSGVNEMVSDNNGQTLFTFSDLKPGDQGTATFNMKVTSNDAYACAKTTMDSFNENGVNDPESDVPDTTPALGELQNYLQFATFADLNINGIYDAGEPVNVGQYIPSHDTNGLTSAEVNAAGWVGVADTSSPNTWLTIDKLVSPQTYGAGLLYCFGSFTTTGTLASTVVTGCNGAGVFNDAQTDSVSGSIQFSSVQTRNNPGYLCSSLNIN